MDMLDATGDAARELRALLTAALLLAQAHATRQRRDLHDAERQVIDRQRDATRRVDADHHLTPAALLGEAQPSGVEGPLSKSATRWATARLTHPTQQGGEHEAQWLRDYEAGLRASGVDPDQVVRDHHAGPNSLLDPDTVHEVTQNHLGARDTDPAERSDQLDTARTMAVGEVAAEQATQAAHDDTADTAGDGVGQPGQDVTPGMWQDGSDAARLAGQSFTTDPAAPVTPRPARSRPRSTGLGRRQHTDRTPSRDV